MVPFQQVYHFVHQNVFQTVDRLLCQFKVYPYPSGFDVTGAPLGFHQLNTQFTYLNADNRLPKFNKLAKRLPEFLPVPII
jgi:hypothetical protein